MFNSKSNMNCGKSNIDSNFEIIRGERRKLPNPPLNSPLS